MRMPISSAFLARFNVADPQIPQRKSTSSIGRARKNVQQTAVPPGLEPYRRRLLSVCGQLRADTERNLTHIGLGRDELLEDVLSDTQQVMQYVRLLGARLASAVVRCDSRDSLTLATIT